MMCCCVSLGRKANKLSTFIFFDDAHKSHNTALVCSAAVIVCRVGQYNSSSDDMMIMLYCELDKVDPILMRLL